MASTRLVVTSRSSTASSPRVSIPSTASPAAVRASPRTRASPGASTNSRSQERRTFIARSRELAEEAQVVLVEEADVVDAVAHHGHPVDAEAEGEAGDGLRVVGHPAQARVHGLED